MDTIAILARTAAAVALAAGAHLAHAAQFVVGQVGPMSGLEANQGRAYAVGMQLVFDSVNKAGGVNGHTIKLVRKDDGGRPEDTISATRQLLADDRPLVLAGYFGNRNVADLVASGMLEKERISLVGYRTAEIRPDTPYVYNVRASLVDEINKITEHLATIGITKLALFYEEGPGAPALIAAADEAAKKAKATIVSRASYPAGTARVTPAVDLFVKAAPQAVIMVATGGAAAGFIEQYRSSGGAAQLFSYSGADIEQMAKRLSEEQLQGIAIAQVTPSPYKVTSFLAKELNDHVARTPNIEVPVSYSMMEGYIAGKVIVEAIRRQGARPTREGMAAALEGIDKLNLGGYAVSFHGRTHGSRFVELTIVTGAGKIRH